MECCKYVFFWNKEKYLPKQNYFLFIFFYWILQRFLTKSVCFTFVVVCRLWTVTAAIVVKFNFRFVIKIFVFIIFSKLTDIQHYKIKPTKDIYDIYLFFILVCYIAKRNKTCWTYVREIVQSILDQIFI